MIIITDIDSLHLKNTVVVLGNFDGIHKGHLTLLHKAKEIAESQNLKTILAQRRQGAKKVKSNFLIVLSHKTTSTC